MNGFPDFFLGFRDDQTRSYISSVLLVVFGGVDECRGFLVAKVNLIAKNMNVKQFPDVLFALIGI